MLGTPEFCVCCKFLHPCYVHTYKCSHNFLMPKDAETWFNIS